MKDGTKETVNAIAECYKGLLGMACVAIPPILVGGALMLGGTIIYNKLAHVNTDKVKQTECVCPCHEVGK